MNESKLNIYTATILILAIIGQIVSYVAVDQILARTLTQPEQHIYITVSGNKPEAVESVQIGQTETIEQTTAAAPEEIPETLDIKSTFMPEGTLTAAAGVNFFNGFQKETYYNLPMQGVVSIAQSRGIEGEYWEREDGCKMYGDYIIVAAHQGVHPYGSIVETSLGQGIVLDTGRFALTNQNQIDIATTW